MDNIKTWEDRTDDTTPGAVMMAMETEIVDLRAALARAGSAAPAAAVQPSEQPVSLDEPGAMIFGESNSMDTKMNDIQCVASNSLMQRALTLAMEICDAVPSRAHEAPEGDPLRSIGMLVNYQEATGAHGYAVIRDALEFISRDADASDEASWLPTVDAVNALPHGIRQYVQQLEAEVNRNEDQ